MAIKIYCDTCGEPVRGRGARFRGVSGDDATEFQFHDGECYEQAVKALAGLARPTKTAVELELDDSPWIPEASGLLNRTVVDSDR